MLLGECLIIVLYTYSVSGSSPICYWVNILSLFYGGWRASCTFKSLLLLIYKKVPNILACGEAGRALPKTLLPF